MAQHVLIVDDDFTSAHDTALALHRDGYLATVSANGEEALALFDPICTDLVLLEAELPGIDGFELLRRLRRWSSVPVIVVTRRARPIDEVIGLNLGADDYLTKPVEGDVLLAHVRAVLRRYNAGRQKEISVGDMRIDAVSRAVYLKEREVILPPKEFGILLALAENLGQVLSAEDLVARVWGNNWIGETQTVYVHVRWLREKIESDPGHPDRLITVKGAGYKLNSMLG